MKESFLHYLWQYQYFDKRNFQTTEGEPIQIFNPGNRNSNAGPDFLNSRIKIGNIEWIGSVEIHIRASGWIDHKHHTDFAYENVVLHVVWENDKPVKRSNDSPLPTVELKNKVDEHMLLKYARLMNNPDVIPCANVFSKVNDLLKGSMLDRVLAQRLETKARAVLALLEHNHNDWEETCYQLLFKNFGFKVNMEPFLQLGQALPYKLVLRHADKLLQVESLLFGQAGFLADEDGDSYYQLLRREYNILRQKYQLTGKQLSKAQWKFLRLRPANFPTIRVAQLATLLYQQKNIFSRIISAGDFKTVRDMFSIQQSAYWQHHYQFGKESKDHIATFGEMSIDNVIVNTVVPILAAYSSAKDEQLYMERATEILHHLPAETNTVTRQWVDIGLKCKTTFDSQALIELNNNFCLRRRCLECTIGASLVNPASR